MNLAYVSNALAQSTGYPAACAGMVTEAGYSQIDITLTFNGDGSYQQTGSSLSYFKLWLDADCAENYLGVPASAEACANYQAVLEAGTPQGGSATCAYAGGGCRCSWNIPAQADASGTYSVTGSTLHIESSAGGSADFPFCARDGTLTLVQQNATVTLVR